MAALSSLAPLSLSVLPRSKSLMRPLDASVIGRDVAGVRRSGSGRGNGRGGDALASEPREDGERTCPTEPRGRGAAGLKLVDIASIVWWSCCGSSRCLVKVLRIVWWSCCGLVVDAAVWSRCC